MKKKWLSLLMSLPMLFAVGCGTETTGGEEPPVNTGPAITEDGIVEKQSSQELAFVTSDARLNSFMNDFFERQVGANGKKVVELDVGQGGTAWKEWEAMSLMWFDSTETGALTRESIPNGYSKILSDLRGTPIDRYGYIWSTVDEEDTPDSNNSYTNFDQGWPFPSFEHCGAVSHGFGNNFNTADTATQTAWEVENGAGRTASGNLLVSARTGATELKVSLVNIDGGYAFFAPFMETELKYSGNDEKVLDDLYIEWATADGETYSVSYSEAGTQEKDVNENGHYYFNMSEVEGWGRTNDICKTGGRDADKEITDVSLVFRTKSGADLDGVEIRVDFLRSDYDDRCLQNNAIFINTLAEYYRYTGNDEVLAELIGKARRAYQFYLTYCNGTNGLIDQENFVGHDGIPISGHGISPGYFDILALPSTDFYFNVYFYKATKSMEYLERMAEAAGIEAETVSVGTPDLKSSAEYQETAQTLSARLSLIAEKATEEFWSEEKGRFIEGTIDWDATGHLNDDSALSELGNLVENDEIDYGFLAFNLEAVACGMASDEQAKLIMDWCTGVRNVEGDTATSDAALVKNTIYYFECAPRISTKSNSNQYAYGGWASSQIDFGRQVQDGGSAMWVTYYDLVSRQRVYGADSAYERIYEIVDWYEDVTEEYLEDYPDDDNPTQFYRSYYTRSISLQGGGQSGGLGLDCEFLENAIVYAAFPQITLGLNSTQYKTLDLAPSLPSSLLYYKMENLAFHGVKYDVTAGNDFVRMSNVRDNAVGSLQGKHDGLNVCIRLPEPEGNYSVLVDGSATTDYTVQNGEIVLTLPFGNFYVKVQ